MSPKQLAATISEVKLIVAQSMAEHIEDERILRHETAKHTGKMFDEIKKNIDRLVSVSSKNQIVLEQHMEDEHRTVSLIVRATAAIIMFIVGWLSWLSLVTIQQGQDISSQAAKLDAIPRDTVQEMLHYFESN